MTSKEISPAREIIDEPVEVFRQFAWHLAGTLAATTKTGGGASVVAKPRPAKVAGRR
jgi:hypothetical protein